MRVATVLIPTMLLVSQAFTQRLTIPELVERATTNPIELSSSRELVDTTIGEIVSAATVIVEGTVTPVYATMSPDQFVIYTDYAVNVAETFRDQRIAPAKARGILVKQLGGTIRVLGKEVRYHDTDVPPWPAGTRLLLFLKESATDAGKFELALDGTYGAFVVTDENVTPWVKPASILRDARNMTRAAFLERVRHEMSK